MDFDVYQGKLLFQTLYSISSEKNHTIVFPLPIDVIGTMMSGGSGEESKKSGGKGKRVKKESSGAEKEKSKGEENIGILAKTEKGRSAILGVGMGINAAGAGSGGESDKKSL